MNKKKFLELWNETDQMGVTVFDSYIDGKVQIDPEKVYKWFVENMGVENKELINKFGMRAVEDYQNEKAEGLTLVRLQNYLNMLSGYSAQLEEEYAILSVSEARHFNDNREGLTSDKQVEKLWLSTQEGMRQLYLKHHIKSVDKIISAIKLSMRRQMQEAYNIN